MNFPAEVIHGCRTRDDVYDYKTLTLTMELYMKIPRTRTLSREELAALKIAQSDGWEHYHSLPHERHILMLRKRRTLEADRSPAN